MVSVVTAVDATSVDSDSVVRPVLAKRFERIRSDLNDGQAVAFLCDAVRALSADAVRVVSLVGGAASGKSTMAKAIVNQLAQSGVRADSMSTDDFNKGDRAWRWEHFEGENAEDPIGKYDFDLLNKKIEAIKQNKDPNKTIAVPTYDQATGLAIDAGEENYTHKIGPIDVLLVEGDFHPVNNPDLVVFLHVPDAQRLHNRITRDVVHRGGDRVKTTNSFNFRHHKQHIPYTVPTVEKADIVLDVKPNDSGWLYDVYQVQEIHNA